MNILDYVFSIKYESIYCKITILGIRITTKPKRIPKRYIDKIIKREFEIIKNKNYEEKDKKLAVLLSAGIGDYFLFRPFLQHIREYYKDYNITLIVAVCAGNYVDIIKNFDVQYTDEIILFPLFTNNFDDKFLIFLKILKYDILISHFYGRGYPINNMVSKLNADIKIGSFGSLWHESRYGRVATLNNYNKIIFNNVDEDTITHELDNNRVFLKNYLI